MWYQLPRWAQGLDPTYVAPLRIERSAFPIVLYMAEVHPFVWMAIILVVFVRLCGYYGWRLEK